MRTRRTLGVFVVVLAALVSHAAAQEINPVTYTASGWTLQGPAEIPAGMTTITLDNQQAIEHTFGLISLSGGRTMDDFGMAMGQLESGELSVVPDWINFHGGVSVGAGQAASYTIFLGPGNYVLLAPFGDDQGPFAARGLIMMISVVAPEVASSLSITLQDYEFVLNGSFRAGAQTVRVENIANQPHEVLILALPPGVGLMDLLSAPPPEGDAAGEPAPPTVGLWAINPGTTAYLELNLAPGNYGMLCFVPDADGPHFMQGMTFEFEVR